MRKRTFALFALVASVLVFGLVAHVLFRTGHFATAGFAVATAAAAAAVIWFERRRAR